MLSLCSVFALKKECVTKIIGAPRALVSDKVSRFECGSKLKAKEMNG